MCNFCNHPRYALRDLWESEKLYIEDLKFTLDQYYSVFGGDGLPEGLQGKRDMVFSSLPDIHTFHDQSVQYLVSTL